MLDTPVMKVYKLSHWVKILAWFILALIIVKIISMVKLPAENSQFRGLPAKMVRADRASSRAAHGKEMEKE